VSRDLNYERVMAMMEEGPLLVSDIRVQGEDRGIGFWRAMFTGQIASRCGCKWGDGVAPAGSPTYLCEEHR
jgi:hypothetical protein